MVLNPKSRVVQTETGLTFYGEIDHQTIPDLIETIKAVGVSGPVLDLSAVSRIDSAGLAFLISWGNDNLPKGQQISILGAQQQLRQLVSIMRLEAIFDLG